MNASIYYLHMTAFQFITYESEERNDCEWVSEGILRSQKKHKHHFHHRHHQRHHQRQHPRNYHLLGIKLHLPVLEEEIWVRAAYSVGGRERSGASRSWLVLGYNCRNLSEVCVTLCEAAVSS